MKRTTFLVIVIANLLLSSTSMSIATSPKLGEKCSKLGLTATVGGKKLACTKSGKKLLWKYVNPAKQSVTALTTTSNTETTGTESKTTAVQTPTNSINYYSPKDQSNVQLLNATESCSNPKNATFEIQALVGSEWLPVKLLESGWNASSIYCSNPDLGARNSLAWAKVYMDSSTKYRWIFSGEINFQYRDANGRGITQPIVFTAPWKPQPFKAKIPISLPVSQSGAITFSNIVEKFSQIPQVAWNNSQKVIQMNTTPKIGIDVFTGPNTKVVFPGGDAGIKDLILKTAKLYDGFSQVPYVSVVSYTSADETWAEAKLKEIAAQRGYPDIEGPLSATRGNCQQSSAPGQFSGSISACRGSNAGPPVDSTEALIEFGMDGGANDPYFTLGALVAHEYTHTVQDANWIGNPNCRTSIDAQGNAHCHLPSMANQGFSPCWLFEGVPQANGRVAISNTYSDYLTLRQGEPYGWGATTITDYKEESLWQYLYNQSAPTCYQNGALYKLGYSLGFFTTEALIAIGGPQSTMALYSLGAEGNDFPTAFKGVYGISWDEASKILAKVLAAEYETFGAPPK